MIRLLLLMSLLVLCLAGCRQAESEIEATAPESICVGEAAFVEVDSNRDLSAATVTSTFIRGTLSGLVISGGEIITSIGAIKEVTGSGLRVSGAMSFEYACLRPGQEIFVVTGEPADGDLTTLRTRVEIECVDCGLPDPVGDFIDSVSQNEPTLRLEFFDQVAFRAQQLLKLAGLWAELDRELACGLEDDEALLVCSADTVSDPDDSEGVVQVTMKFADVVPRRQGNSLIYTAAVESDGVAGNDWEFQPPFDWDLFRGTDRWYQLIYDHVADTWSLVVVQVEPGPPQAQVTVPSAAKVIVENDQVTFLIPRGEFPGDNPRVRTTSFGHDGAFNVRGGDVSGADPTEMPAAIERVE